MKKRRRLWLLVIPFLIGICFFLFTRKNPTVQEEEPPEVTTNYVEAMSFSDGGISFQVYMKQEEDKLPVFLCYDKKKNCQESTFSLKKDHLFEGELNLSTLKNNTYDIWIGQDKKERLADTRSTMERIQRAKIKDKLVTISYDKNRVKVKVEDFQYEYDILIDPGHGGDDTGSFNKYINEEKLNLEQSFYEKKRYEAHGLKVKLIRDDDSYGIKMGDKDWPAVRQRAYAIGYYGVVSRVSYSNHHNSSESKKYSGWEIIVPAELSQTELAAEKKVASSWEKSYKVLDKHIRFYTRDAKDGGIYSKMGEESYSFADYYAVIRIPGELFQVKNILYEGCYLSNLLDYDWYYTKGNWKKLSEAKIKAYVESLGKTYVAPKS